MVEGGMVRPRQEPPQREVAEIGQIRQLRPAHKRRGRSRLAGQGSGRRQLQSARLRFWLVYAIYFKAQE